MRHRTIRYAVEAGIRLSETAASETHDLTEKYFDTEDLRLAARGITLSRAPGGEWHLSVPGEPDETLTERPALAAHTRGHALVKVATRTVRRTVTALPGDSATLTDDEVIATAGGRTETWREITLDGPAEALEAVEERLRNAGARPAPPRLGSLLPPREALREYVTAGDVITAYIAEQTETILAYDPRVRRAEYDSVHKMRVAVRRIRSILRTAEPLVSQKRARRLEAELKWLATALGEVRDLEVLRERFAGRLEEIGEPAPEWLTGLGAKERKAYKRLNRTLGKTRYFAILDALDAFVDDPPFTERASRKAPKAVPKLVARAWRRVLRRQAELEHAKDVDEARHRTRKAAKRARYTAEAARPVLGEPARQLAAQASKVQETLGAYQDSVIAREHLAELGPEENVGALIDIERRAADQALEDAREIWAEATDPGYVRALTR
jgi:CHAD domain-containing protein